MTSGMLERSQVVPNVYQGFYQDGKRDIVAEADSRYQQNLSAWQLFFWEQLIDRKVYLGDQRYLNLVATSFGGGPVGIETIAAALSEPRDAIEDIIEPYLIQQGFLQRTPRGRVLTAPAFKHLGLVEPKRELPQFGLFTEEE